MSALIGIGIGFLALCAGVGLVALLSRRVGNSGQEALALLATAVVLVIGFLVVVQFVDQLPMNANQRWWALRAGFVALTLLLWRMSTRVTGRSVR
jgi:cell division protein FtsW (lipid II flippase)